MVPKQLQNGILEENYSGLMAGHFVYKKCMVLMPFLVVGRYVYQSCHNCLQCAISGRKQKPPLHLIPIQRALKTKSGNQYTIVFQDFLTKWPKVFAAPDQKAYRIVCLLAKEVVSRRVRPRAVIDSVRGV